jgi:hypothetical protein
MVAPMAATLRKGQLVNQRSFGRRGTPPPSSGRSTGTTDTFAQATSVQSTRTSIERPVRLSEKNEFSSFDDELRQWKLARKQNFEIPWRPLSLMATLCFGIASFVLPDSVNDNVQWLLYALAAASLYAGFRKRHRHAKN